MILGPDGHKMSKSPGNVISPMPIVDRYGADAARCYILFIGPPDQDAAWSESVARGRAPVPGAAVAAGRPTLVRRACASRAEPPRRPEGDDLTLVRKANWAIDKVTSDMTGRFTFNTAIAAMMELINDDLPATADAEPAPRGSRPRPPRRCCSRSRRTWAPRSTSCSPARACGTSRGPTPTRRMLQADTFELVCQVNGKVRDRVTAATGASREELERLCMDSRGVQAHVDGTRSPR